MNTADAEARAQIRQFMPPLTIIVISLPLVLGLIPRNGFYGIRVREAFASDANWYAINRLGSIALIGACLVWMAAAAYAPRRFVKPVGIAAVVLTLAALALTQGWTPTRIALDLTGCHSPLAADERRPRRGNRTGAPAGLEAATPGLEGCVSVAEAALPSAACEECHAFVPREPNRR
jgi:hypothetical protein